jgi:hypothetical protein
LQLPTSGYKLDLLSSGGESKEANAICPKVLDKEDTQMNMKRIGLLATGIGVLISVGLLTVEQGYTEEKEHATTCSLTTVKGRYLFVVNGTYFPPAAGVKVESLFTRAGYRIFNGDGTGTTIVTNSINGVITGADAHLDLSYTVNADCTGTFKVQVAPGVQATSEMFIAPNGDDMTIIATDNGHVEAYSSWRVEPE